MNHNDYLRKYARFAVRVGSNVQPGQALIINAPVTAVDFARMCVAEGYAAGAREVIVHYKDEQVSRMRMMCAPEEVLADAKPWIQDSYVSYIKQPGSACILSIIGEDPEIYKDIAPSRVDIAARARSKAMSEYYEYTMASRVQWSIVAIPAAAWSTKVFPGKTAQEANAALWEAIFTVCRIDENDPVDNWAAPLHTMHSRADWLNKLQLDALHLTAANGTDLVIGLPKNHIWGGGSEYTPAGVEFLPNIPTEEVFTAPDRLRVDGVVHGTKPYVYHGSLIKDFGVRFEAGRVVEHHAAEGEDLLGLLLDTDEGARRIGEIALVPATSPINRSGLLFYNTLFDENAACHIAFGEAYPTCVAGGEAADEEGKKALGLNVSDVHEDVMVGSEDMNIDGILPDGTVVPVFRGGVWA